jgi:hypothetical protein
MKQWLVVLGCIAVLVSVIAVNQRPVQQYFACQSQARQDASKGGALPASIKVSGFHSGKLNTCIETRVEANLTGTFSYLIRDVGHGFIVEANLDALRMRAQTDVGGLYADTTQNLFFCDREGVDNVLLEKVRQHRGLVWNLSYVDYMDDYNGGPPRTNRAPDKMLTDAECRAYFHRKLSELR